MVWMRRDMCCWKACSWHNRQAIQCKGNRAGAGCKPWKHMLTGLSQMAPCSTGSKNWVVKRRSIIYVIKDSRAQFFFTVPSFRCWNRTFSIYYNPHSYSPCLRWAIYSYQIEPIYWANTPSLRRTTVDPVIVQDTPSVAIEESHYPPIPKLLLFW